MQQAAASGQYGVPNVPQFGGGGTASRTHVLGISSHEGTPSPSPSQLQANQNQNQNQQQLLQHSGQVGQPQKVDSSNEIPSPIASRAPLRSAASFETLMPSSGSGSGGGGGGGGQFGEEEGLGGDEGGERGGLGSVGNRWPRQETLALLKIRSEMDATFRDASLKGPLWEDVSRKLAELGYHRSAKKCKEKFENVHKYYKRTKDGRAGRQDGKSYRFFSQLEALHSNNNSHNSSSGNVNHARNSNNMQAMSSGPGPARLIQPSASAPGPLPAPALLSDNANNAIGGEMNRNCGTDANPVAIRHSADFSAGNLSFSSESSDEDDYEEQTDSRKRKRSSSGGSVKKMMLFFEHLMKQVMEKQEMMQQKFLETIEKREQDRMIREEAWKRQEMGRLHREHEIMAQERALSASRDAALISFLHKVTGQTFQVPSMTPHAQSTTSINPVPPETYHHHHHHENNNSNINNDPDAGAIMNVNTNAEQMELSFDANSNRWPKPEVHALIKLRSAMEARYQDAGPKGPLWEEISAGMARLGYNRSSKRCKEKWENINKYFKKVKESNKKRPEDAKTCPYFHQLDQLYRKRIVSRQNSVAGKQEPIDVVACIEHNNDRTEIQGTTGTEQILAIMPPLDNNNNNNNNTNNNNSSNGGDVSKDGAAIPTSNGAVHTTFYSSPEDDGIGSATADQRALKKVKMKPQTPNFSSFHDEYGVLVESFGAGKTFDSNDFKSYVLKPESLVMEDVIDMDDDDMQSAGHHHHHHHEQQSMVDDYDDKIEGEDSDNNNENEQQENHHHHHRHHNNLPTTASANNNTHDRQSVDHLPFAQFVHDNRTGSSVSIAASTAANSFMAMVHRLAASSDPPEFKSSKA